jgi:hypothetical protein
MLNPFKYGVFALRLWSHKVLRWWVPVALVAVFIANVMLVDKHWVYELTLGVQLAFYTLALGGFLLRRKRRQPFMLRIPFYFCLVNYASGIGLMEAMIGKSYTTWTTARAQG